MIGQVLGSYRVVSRLGSGGMGTVWLAEHQLLGSRAAIKVLLPEMSGQTRMVQRFFDEARAATRIQDPGIVTVLDFGWTAENHAYLVMEHLNGETLADRLQSAGTLPVAQAVRLLQHCAIAMAAAHARGIVHRDLKPDNIFLVLDPAVPGGERIKILDFGIAKLIDDPDANHGRTQTGVIMGTPAFMSPEQCRGAGGVDHRTDVYALGCVMYNMVIGHPPFVAPTAGDLIAHHLREEPQAPSALAPGIPAALDAVVLRCLAKAPEDRFQTMTELVRASAQLSGENHSIETIPPLLASGRGSKSLVETFNTPVPPSNTTLRGSTGETFSRARPWRGGLVVVAAALVMIGVFAFIATRKRETRSSEAPAAVVDAGVASAPDAPHPVIGSAGSKPPEPPRQPPVTKPVTKPVVAKPPIAKPTHGSAKKPTGSGSGSGYDPYADR